MVVELGFGTPGDGTAGVLNWVPGSPRVEYAVHDAARLLKVSDVASVTDMAALEAVARLSIWRAAEGALAHRYATVIDGESRHAEQVWEHAKSMVARYEAACARLGIATAAGAGTVKSYPVKSTESPYAQPAASGAEF
jgi:hypothetical protein